MTQTKLQENINVESFAELFEESIRNEKREGSVIEGIIIAITHKEIVVDAGLKSEGRISIKEFQNTEEKFDYKIGDTIEVYIERAEDRDGHTVLSREKAIREKAWFKFEDLHKQGVNVQGVIIGRVKGGFAVDLGGIIAFLPGSQVDIRPIKDITILINLSQEDFTIENGERIAQMVLAKHEKIDWEVVEVLSDTQRGAGGYGSTGVK